MVFDIICVVLLYMSRHPVSSQVDTLGTRRDEVLSRIDKYSPPLSDPGASIDVNMTFTLLTVADLDSKQQVLTVTGSLTLSWHDTRVAWNGSESSGISFVELEEHDIWRPRIVLANSVDNMDPIQSKNPVILYHTGRYRWERKAIFRVRCKIDISLYPFDTQFCRLMFAPAFGYMLNITIQDTIIRQSVLYDNNAEYIVQNITQDIFQLDDGMYAAVGVSLMREPTFYIITVIIPIMLMSLLNPFVFLIPARSGEKLGFIMAVFVSHTMFLTIMRESVPPSISNLTRFLIAIEVQTFLTILASILVIAIHHRKERAEELRDRKKAFPKMMMIPWKRSDQGGVAGALPWKDVLTVYPL